VSWNAESRSWEPAQDILDYLKFAGFDVSRDQLARLHRRRLISQPSNGVGAGRAVVSMYPAGTAERMLRISQLKEGTKQFDELAWRLWWEGFSVEPDLVRAYLMKKALRWDDQLLEIRSSTPVVDDNDSVEGERDVLEEVFFQHLKAGPALVSARKQLARGTELYIGLAGLLVDLLRGDLSIVDSNQVDLFAATPGSADVELNAQRSWRAGRAAILAMRDDADTPYSHVVEQLDDVEIERARVVALRFLAVIANVGATVQGVFGRSARGRDNIGRSLIGLSESSDEQVVSLLLTSSFLKDKRVRESLAFVEPLAMHNPAITLDYMRLRFLAGEVPGLMDLLSESQMIEAFGSGLGAQRWHETFESFRHDHAVELEVAMALRPDLFDAGPPVEEISEPVGKVKSKKKNPK
jgi:hypothetical protein